jgi:hypothetical protein
MDAFDVISFSLRKTYRQIDYLLRLSVWGCLLSLPIVSLPAAQLSFYEAVREMLVDTSKQLAPPRQAIFQGMRRNFVRSYKIFLIDILACAIIMEGITFWIQQDGLLGEFFAGMSILCLLVWWICQPLILPLLVEFPEDPSLVICKKTVMFSTRNPVFMLSIVLSLTLVDLLGIILLGPALLVFQPFIAITAIRALWTISGIEIPELEGVN